MISTQLIPPRPTTTSRWLWLLLGLAFALFVAAVVALLMLYQRAETEEQRATLISDALWLEQDLRFNLMRHEEILGQISPQQAADVSLFEAQAKTLLANKTGLRQVLWVDGAGRVRQSYPGPTDAYIVGEAQDVVPSRRTLQLARSLGRAVYSEAYPIIDDDWQFEVQVPVFHEGRLLGTAVGAYSIQRMLNESVPWWLAERYRVSVVDHAGSTLVTRSTVAAADEANAYQIPFEPPGHGLSLQAVPYRTPSPPAGRILSAALVLLALVVIWSLWALRRHVKQRLAAEEALRDEYIFRKAMEDSLLTGMRARDTAGRITYVNPAFCRMVGWPAEELVGRAPPMPYWPDEYYAETRQMHDRILAGEGPEEGFELKFKRRSGELFDVFIHEAPLIDARGRHTGWMGSLIDISERKHSEELARQQQERLQSTARLVAMGEMASSLAHELNQPLAAIASYNAGCANMIEAGEPDMAELKAALLKSAEQAQRAGRIIRRIYEFVRRAEPRSEPCQLAGILDEVVLFVDADARRHGLRVVQNVSDALPAIRGDRILITQALLNLVRNAMDASRDVADERRQIDVTASADSSGVLTAVRDRGCGIDAETAARLFEPFYTTKSEGMGMGLNICRSVVEAHHGRLWYEPNIDGGSTFYVQFPMPSA